MSTDAMTFHSNSGNGCGNEEYASYLNQEIIYILCFTEINSTIAELLLLM